jgi:uncharacterized protein (DUF3084 family)
LKTDKIKDEFKAKGLPKAREIWDYERLSPEEKAIYAREQDAKKASIDQIFSAKLYGIEEGIEKGRKEAEKKYAPVIEEKDKALEEKDKALEERDKALEEKNKALEEKAQDIERLKRLVEQAGYKL